MEKLNLFLQTEEGGYTTNLELIPNVSIEDLDKTEYPICLIVQDSAIGISTSQAKEIIKVLENYIDKLD